MIVTADMRNLAREMERLVRVIIGPNHNWLLGISDPYLLALWKLAHRCKRLHLAVDKQTNPAAVTNKGQVQPPIEQFKVSVS